MGIILSDSLSAGISEQIILFFYELRQINNCCRRLLFLGHNRGEYLLSRPIYDSWKSELLFDFGFSE